MFVHLSVLPVLCQASVGTDVDGKSCFIDCWLVLLLYVPSTAMVIAGRSVHLTALFPGQA